VGHGFVVEVFCLHRCTIAGTLILARHGPALSFHGRGSGARVTRLGVALTPAFARALAAARRAQVAITVLTRIGRTTRRVHVIVRLSG
jgi:hypothetical protein